MNAIKKCAVINCVSDSSLNKSISFQIFPSTKHIALKWLENLEHLIPYLFYQPVQNLYVCEKHFENRFLTKFGTVTGNAYPTLFTQKEITTGVPTNLEHAEYQTYKDHNYCMSKKDIPGSYFIQKTTVDSEKNQNIRKQYSKNVPITDKMKNTQHNLTSILKKNNNVTIRDLNDSKGQPIFRILPSSPKDSKGQPISRTLPSSPNGSKPNDYSSNIDTAMDFDNDTAMDYNNDNSVNKQQVQDAPEFTSPPRITHTSAHMIIKTDPSIKMLERKYRQSLKLVKKLENTIKTKNERIKRLSFDKKTWFDRLTKHVDNPLAKKFLWMQVRSHSKTSQGRRFTDEEKTICVFIRKQNPQCYKILSKIFTLPSDASLRKFLQAEMAPKNKDDPVTS